MSMYYMVEWFLLYNLHVYSKIDTPQKYISLDLRLLNTLIPRKLRYLVTGKANTATCKVVYML